MFPQFITQGQQPLNPFVAATAQQSSMFNMAPPQQRGAFEQFGPLGGLITPAVNTLFGDAGFVAAQFQPTQNVYDQLRAQSWQRRHQASLAEAAQSDIPAQVDFMRGVAKRAGYQWDDESEASAKKVAADLSKVMPYVAQFAPGMVDSFHGPRGSATVMAQNLSEAGRFVRDSDGTQGLRAETIGTISKTIQEQLYGDRESIRDMQGMGMGAAGQLYSEMVRRGMTDRGIGTFSLDEQKQKIAEQMASSGKSDSLPEALREVEGMSQTDFDQKLREFDAEKIAGKVKGMAGAVSAMRDIFGDLGNPDAPMSQVMNGLNALTQGGFANMPAAQVEKIVRDTKSLADNTGTSIEAIVALTTHATQFTDREGLERPLAVQAGLHAAAYGQGYNNLGLGSAWGSMSRERAMGMDARLTAQAAGSRFVNRAAALSRTADAFDIEEDSQLGKLVAAARRGDTEFEGQDMSEALADGNVMQMMTQAGLSGNAMNSFRTMLQDPFGNQQEIMKYDMASKLGRQAQRADWMRNIGNPAGVRSIQSALRASGMDGKQAQAIAQKFGGRLAQKFLDSDFDPNDPEARANLVKELRAEGLNVNEDVATSMAEDFFSQANRLSRDHGGQGDVVKDRQMFGESALREARLVTAQAENTSKISQSYSRIGRDGVVQRVIDMASSDEDMSIPDAIRKGLGQLGEDDVVKAHMPALQRIVELDRDLKGLKGSGKDGQFTEDELKQQQRMSEELYDAVDSLGGDERLAELFGITPDGKAKDPEELAYDELKRMAGAKFGGDPQEAVKKLRTAAEGKNFDAIMGSDKADEARALIEQVGDFERFEKKEEAEKAAAGDKVAGKSHITGHLTVSFDGTANLNGESTPGVGDNPVNGGRAFS